MKNSNKSTGGIWMLVGLFGLLMAPIVVDHLANPAHADSEQASAAAPAAPASN